MIVRISVMVLRIAALLASLRHLFWTGSIQGAESLKNPWTSVHMMLGIIVTICLIVLGSVMITTKGGNVGLGGGAIVLSILLVALGLGQVQPALAVPSVNWLVKIVHLLVVCLQLVWVRRLGGVIVAW